MNPRMLLSTGAALWLGSVACASRSPEAGAPATTEAVAPAPAAAARRDAMVLSAAELESGFGRTLYDHIRRVRPQWLSTRGPTTLAQAERGIVVYRDGVRVGGVSTLQDIMTDIVESVRFLSGPEASGRYGLDHQHGAILVVTRK